MPVKAIKLGFLGLNAVRIDEMRHHFGQVIGLDTSEQAGGETYFACGNENVAFSLHRSDEPGYKYLGFQVAGEGRLDDVLAALRESGIPAAQKSDVLPGVPSAVEINDVDGHRILLYRESARAPLNAPARGIAPEKLGHVALFSGDPGKSLDFFCQNLGFRWSDWLADILVFLRCNADHHALNFCARRGPGCSTWRFSCGTGAISARPATSWLWPMCRLNGARGAMPPGIICSPIIATRTTTSSNCSPIWI